MNQGKTVFSQIMDFLPMAKFRHCVERNSGNYRVRSFTCLDQFLCMAFNQLTYRESLRDIECCLRAMRGKLYHMGIGHIKFRPHDLRRHAATYASRSGVPIEVVSKVILRHSNLSTTQRYLGKISETEAMSWIDNLYR